MNLILIFVGAVLVNNFVMNKFMGCCPFLGVSKKTETAFGMGMAVTFVITVASLATYFVRSCWWRWNWSICRPSPSYSSSPCSCRWWSWSCAN